MATLYVVSTPIGNLKDITLRALEVLKSVDIIFCEDTRVGGKLLSHYDIDKKLVSVNDFNEERKVADVLNELKEGRDVALISDAGTPLISDPGYKIVREAIKEGFIVEALPGPSSPIIALTVSGLAPDKFLFVGYLPKKEGKKKELLEKLKKTKEDLKLTIIAFESPFRLLKTLDAIEEVFGNIEMVVARELTKMHEELVRAKISDIKTHFEKKRPKGELVVLI
ncbi:MAG: 16S rRNA (cytidine(1402)-2'-O)-methyltransferase [Candidatus Curtissbacteria bacterium]|nr:16S rRNA (cytidine(1402)-2'-O)-methyltransferase [Candidatus Curtissbacteria bacterium]